jgi:hypothetical protein
MKDNADQLPLEPIGGQQNGLNRWVIGIGLVIGCLLIGYGWFALQWRWPRPADGGPQSAGLGRGLLWRRRFYPGESTAVSIPDRSTLYRSGMGEGLLAATGWSAGGLLIDRAGRRVEVGKSCDTGVELEVRMVGR